MSAFFGLTGAGGSSAQAELGSGPPPPTPAISQRQPTTSHSSTLTSPQSVMASSRSASFAPPTTAFTSGGSPPVAGSSASSDGFLALHPTTSAQSTSTVRGSSFDDARSAGSPPPIPSPLAVAAPAVVSPAFAGGLALSRPSTAPVPARSSNLAAQLEAHPEADQPETDSNNRPLMAEARDSTATEVGPSRPRVSRRSSAPGTNQPQPQATPSSAPRTRHRPSNSISHAYAQPVSPSVRMMPLGAAPPRPPSAHTLRSPASYSSSPSGQAHSPQASLQSHLYTSGLLGATLADVHLVAFHGFYRLHRIVLGQSGFFTSLLSGGFAEERTGPPRKVQGGDEGEVIELELHLPMTRAAFEFCLARLYGGGPELVPPPWASTSGNHPLSFAFEKLWQGSDRTESDERESWDALHRPDVQPATPTFLISLLAVSTYLEIPSIQTQALSLIHATMTPWTVGQYLAFALGHGLGHTRDQTDLEAACRGLEGVAAPWDSSRARTRTASVVSSAASSFAGSTHPSEAIGEDEMGSLWVGPEGARVGEAVVCWLAKWSGEVLEVEEKLALHSDGGQSGVNAPPGTDTALLAPPMRVWSSLPGGLPARWVRGIISSDAFFLSPSATQSAINEVTPDSTTAEYSLGADGEFARYLFARRVVELRRREKSAIRQAAQDRRADAIARSVALKRQASTGVSSLRSKASNGAGVNSRATSIYEKSVYEMAESASVFEQALEGLTIEPESMQSDAEDETDEDDLKCGARDGESQELNEREEEYVDQDETEYARLFEEGINYSHLSFEQLTFIANDLSPVSGLPYVGPGIVERAFWQSHQFRARIPKTNAFSPFSTHALHSAGPGLPSRDSRVPSPAPPVEADEPAELGLATHIRPSLDPDQGGVSHQRYFLVPVDDTTRINDGPLPGEQPAPHGAPPKLKPSSLPGGPEGFYGLALETRGGTQGGVSGTADEERVGRRFVGFEPCRISVEFWQVGELRDKQRLYSRTFFYAGSFYNLYLQKVQKKGVVQLGVYLHRQNPHEPFPLGSQPPSRKPQSSLLNEVLARSNTATPTPQQTAIGGVGAPFLDKRTKIQAFFSIWCPNQLGTSLTKFSSGPDSFALSQSWGWKSSSLRSAEYIGAAAAAASGGESPTLAQAQMSAAEGSLFSSLRVSIVMGLV